MASCLTDRTSWHGRNLYWKRGVSPDGAPWWEAVSSRPFPRVATHTCSNISCTIDEKVHELGRWIDDPLDILIRVKADVARHEAHQVPRRFVGGGHTNPPTFQVRDVTNVPLCEQLEASDMHA